MADDIHARTGEWFDDIERWGPRQRRSARNAASLFVVIVSSALVLWLVAPRAPGSGTGPMPAWNAADFASGRLMDDIEENWKRGSWVTFALGGLHDAALAGLGISGRGALGQFHYETASGEVFTPDQGALLAERGFVVPVPWETPRFRMMIAPNQRFYLVYQDNAVLQRDWFDAHGRVPVRINQYGLREREDLLETKPPQQRRVLCLGDSLTFGWGVPEESGWVRVLEDTLRARGSDVRTVNCGAAGTVCVDEYWWGLKNRFGRFDPDAVVVAICLNDLVPSSGLCVLGPPRSAGQQLSDVLHGVAARSRFDLDPAVDWVKVLLEWPQGAGLYGPDSPFESMWSQSTPQASLRETKAWCDARSIPLVVTLWPFLQGLGADRAYPFQRLHDLVREQCEADGIRFLDLLPALRGTREEDLWVTPADMHPNPKAHAMVIPDIAAAVAAAMGL
jgi:hypothetical protein